MQLKRLEPRFSVCKLKNGENIPYEEEFVFTGKTDEELSLVCPENKVPDQFLEREDGWRGFRIEGILDFSMIGVIAKISKLLADHEVGIFVISTFHTDYVFVKEENWEKTITLLKTNGYGIG